MVTQQALKNISNKKQKHGLRISPSSLLQIYHLRKQWEQRHRINTNSSIQIHARSNMSKSFHLIRNLLPSLHDTFRWTIRHDMDTWSRPKGKDTWPLIIVEEMEMYGGLVDRTPQVQVRLWLSKSYTIVLCLARGINLGGNRMKFILFCM